MFDLDGLGDDFLDDGWVRLVFQVGEQQTGKVGVQTFVSADQFVGEGQTGHHTSFLQPEDGGEGPGKEDTFDGGERDQSFTEQGIGVLDPSKGPFGLLADFWDGVDGVEQELAFLGVLDVGVDQQGVGFGVDVLDCDLEPVETLGLRDLDLGGEVLDQVFVDDTVGGGEEGKHSGDEESFVFVHSVVPVVDVLGQVDFLGSPEGGLGTLVRLPDLVVLDGEQDGSVLVLIQQGLVLLHLLQLVTVHFVRLQISLVVFSVLAELLL